MKIVLLLIVALCISSFVYASGKFDVAVKIVDIEKNVSVIEENEIFKKETMTGLALMENDKINFGFLIVVIILISLVILAVFLILFIAKRYKNRELRKENE